MKKNDIPLKTAIVIVITTLHIGVIAWAWKTTEPTETVDVDNLTFIDLTALEEGSSGGDGASAGEQGQSQSIAPPTPPKVVEPPPPLPKPKVQPPPEPPKKSPPKPEPPKPKPKEVVKAVERDDKPADIVQPKVDKIPPKPIEKNQPEPKKTEKPIIKQPEKTLEPEPPKPKIDTAKLAAQKAEREAQAKEAAERAAAEKAAKAAAAREAAERAAAKAAAEAGSEGGKNRGNVSNGKEGTDSRTGNKGGRGDGVGDGDNEHGKGKSQTKGDGDGGNSDKPKRSGGGIADGGVISRPAPEYPSTSAENGEEGTVQIEIMVEPNGSVSSAKVAKSSGYTRLDNAALRAFRAGKYKPKSEDGVPIRTRFIVKTQFSLD